ncbi:hypothetical protein ACK280_25335 [Mycobacterium sherrisii]|uniref:hypothetical protein n=1 Tax=Mycobacterium sherrisii TaxID=243061 RepID=UPI00397684F9
MLTGNPASSAAMSALGGSSTDMNPDLLTAQRILAGLVHGSEQSRMLVIWAVAVLKMPEGQQIVIANNLGSGGYLPPTVYLPSSAKLAVNDPTLPIGWAADWWGCQFPSKILVEYVDRIRKTVAGVRVSALVTTELWVQPPTDWTGGDFVGMQHRDAMLLVSEAPKLDAAHQHRLATIDPALAQRVQKLDDGHISLWAAGHITVAVIKAAWGTPDKTGMRLVTDDDRDILQAVNEGRASADRWAEYEGAVVRRDKAANGALTMPSMHAPQDNDGSAAAGNAIVFYRHYFQIGRMIDLVRCWKLTPAPHLAELVYCGIMAGFGPVVAQTIAAIEQARR